MSRVALLGTGAMGSRIAQKLLDAKHQVVVFNRTTDKEKPLLDQGAVSAPTPQAAAEQADIVISMVTDNEASRSVWLHPERGAVMGLSEGAIAIESSTLTVDWTQSLAVEIEHRGATFLDAPVVGSRPQAEAGQLIYLVGGEVETLAQVEDILRCAGGVLHHVGSIGQGMAIKLAVNALFGMQVAALAEILGLLSQYGITRTKAWDCLGNLPVISPAAKGAGNLMLANQHTPLFPIHLVEKDFRYVLQVAQAVGAAMPGVAAAQAIYEDTLSKGYGNDNITAVVQLFS